MTKSEHYFQRAPDFQLTITRAMLETLDLRRTLYVILSGLTAGDGLDFNRAFLFLADSGSRLLRGEMAIGPSSSEEAHRIWEEMEVQAFNLHVIMKNYERWDINSHPLSKALQQFSMPLPVIQLPEDAFTAKLAAVLQSGRAIVSNNEQLRISFGREKLQNFAMVPLMLSEKAIGVIVVDNAYNNRIVEESELDELKSLANLAAIAVERARMHERLKRMATVDGLTGLMNRRYFDENYPERFDLAKQHNENLSLAIVDLDNFKVMNDHHGHLCGDDLLKEVARIILDRTRQDDMAARYGGDEMVLVLPLANDSAAKTIAEQILQKIRDCRIAGAENFLVTASIGVASIDGDCHDFTELIERADKALYQAKSQGRNRVVAYSKKPND